MITTFWRVQAQQRVDNPKLNQFGISPSTAGDIMPMLQSWQHNPEGVPLPIRRESGEGRQHIQHRRLDVTEEALPEEPATQCDAMGVADQPLQ